MSQAIRNKTHLSDQAAVRLSADLRLKHHAAPEPRMPAVTNANQPVLSVALKSHCRAGRNVIRNS
jgi:hypothetical protein